MVHISVKPVELEAQPVGWVEQFKYSSEAPTATLLQAYSTHLYFLCVLVTVYCAVK